MSVPITGKSQAGPDGRTPSGEPSKSARPTFPVAKSPTVSLSNPLCRRAPRAGLTLVELLTVIAVISILISILIPTVSTVRTSARKAKAKIILNQWAAAIETFRQEYGFYPAFGFSDERLLASNPDAEKFVEGLSGRMIDGSQSASPVAGNQKRITFYTFSEGEISEDGKNVVDSFGKTPIAILVDKNYDGIINVETGENDDYAAFPDIGYGTTDPPTKWPTDPDTGDVKGLRAGVAIYSPGPDKNNIITTW